MLLCFNLNIRCFNLNITHCLECDVRNNTNNKPRPQGQDFVELEGVEPSSKQETNTVSTCLVGYWFSNQGWKSTSDPNLSPFSFAGDPGLFPN